MSDLQCAATLVVVRHGQSEGNLARRLSALAPGSSLSALGRAQARAVGRALADRRVAAVYTSPLARTRETGEVVAAELGLPAPQDLPGVAELDLGDLEGRADDASWAALDVVLAGWREGELELSPPGGESGRDVIDRLRDSLQDLADRHRGETVVVVSHGGAMTLALPLLAAGGPRRPEVVPNCGAVELTVDGDGWRLSAWPTEAPDVTPDLGRLLDDADPARNLWPEASGVDAEVVDGVPCARLDLPEPWATQASVTAVGADADVVRRVVGWLGSRSPGRWHLVTRAADADRLAAEYGLTEALRLQVLASATPPQRPPGLRLEPAASPEEFCEVFGAELLPFVAAGFTDPAREWWVLRLDGQVAACARVGRLSGTSYVGGVTVRPDLRGRGLGRAVSALAALRALEADPVAWLHCESHLVPLYRSVGFREVGEHVHLAPAIP